MFHPAYHIPDSVRLAAFPLRHCSGCRSLTRSPRLCSVCAVAGEGPEVAAVVGPPPFRVVLCIAPDVPSLCRLISSVA